MVALVLDSVGIRNHGPEQCVTRHGAASLFRDRVTVAVKITLILFAFVREVFRTLRWALSCDVLFDQYTCVVEEWTPFNTFSAGSLDESMQTQ